MYAKGPYEAKCQLLINRRKSVDLNNCNDSNCKAFNEHSNDMDDVYEHIEDNNLNKERKTLIVFNVMIPDMHSNKNFQQRVTELFIGGRKLNISKLNIRNIEILD